MNTIQKVAVILAGSSMLATAVAPGRQTANVMKAFFGGLSQWTKVTQGRG